MKFTKHIKTFWWGFLLITFSIFLYKKWDVFTNGNDTRSEFVIFLVWICLVLAPLFKEVSLLGISVKKDIEAIKSDVKEQMLNLRAEIQNSISIDNRNQFFLSPPADSQLQMIKERLDKYFENLKVKDTRIKEEIDIPSNAQYLFTIRYQLENEINRIWNNSIGENQNRQNMPISQMIGQLVTSEKIIPPVSTAIRDIYAVCSAAIHGKRISESQIKFIQNTVPKLIGYLKTIN